MAPHSSARSPRSSKLESHTITWSARTTSEVGTVRPSALVSSILWDRGKHEAERYGSHHVPARPVWTLRLILIADNQAGGCSSTDQGSEKRRAGLAIIACSWPPLVELAGRRPTDQSFFWVRTPLDRRFVGAISFSVVFLFCVSARSITISRQSLFVRLSGSDSHHQNYDQRRIDGNA
jgi:hypothetical protein